MKKRDGFLPGSLWLSLLLALACNALAYNGSRLFTAGRVHHNIACPLDDRIPFLPWTVSIYLGCYLFWVVNYLLVCRREQKEAFRFMAADFAAKLVCLACFLIWPTTNTRPEIAGHSLWEEAMRLVYRLDAPDNLFPSIHCLTSWFCFIAVRGNPEIPKWYRAASLAMALLVCVSTLTTKQHVLPDVFGGVALAEASYWFVEKSGFSVRYFQSVTAAAARLRKDKKPHE